MSLRAGTRLDQYEILAPIGSGAMGDVYKAKDTRLDRVVAIKVITATRDLDLQARDRFDREARALAALSHPHICNVYHYGEDAGTPYLVMEYLEGRTVAARLKASGRLPIPEVLRYGTEIADALCAAHHAGIVHRDLKPENVMLTDGGAKLLDLGISKRLPAGESHWYGGTTQLALTRLGTVTGTIPYMAPEQLEGHAPDVRSDIFSFGAVLYEMATGTRAFRGDSEARIIASIMSEEPARASAIEPSVPAALDAVLERCLKKAPDGRYQRSSDLLSAIREVRDAGAAKPAVLQPPPDSPAIPKRRRRRLVIRFSIGISFGVVLLAVTMLTVRNLQPRSSQVVVQAPTSVPTQTASAPAVTWPLTIQKPVGGTIVAAGGIVCGTLGSTCTATLPDGLPVSLTFESDAGRQFAAFTGDCTSSGETTMTGARTCGASFVAADRSTALTATAQAPPPRAPAIAESKPTAPPPRESPAGATSTAPLAGPPATSTPVLPAPPVMASPPPRPVDEETRAKRQIESLVKEYCAALTAMQPAAILRMMPGVSPEAVQTRLAGYKSLTCTVTLPAEFERIDIDAGGSGHAQLRFRMRQEHVLKVGPPAVTDSIAIMTVSRPNRTSPWVIDRLGHESNRK
jgi:serine/threonine protein kinase